LWPRQIAYVAAFLVFLQSGNSQSSVSLKSPLMIKWLLKLLSCIGQLASITTYLISWDRSGKGNPFIQSGVVVGETIHVGYVNQDE